MNLVILPGWCVLSESYGILMSKLTKKGHNVHFVDYSGLAQKFVKPIDLLEYASYVRTYISQKKIQDPVIIGHSFGARVALKLLHTHPALSAPIILSGVPVYRTGAVMDAGAIHRIVRFLLRGWLDRVSRKKIANTVYEALMNESLERDIVSISTQTYLIWGADDSVTPLWMGKKLMNHMKNAHLIPVRQAGHNFIYEEPHKFVAALGTIVRQ